MLISQLSWLRSESCFGGQRLSRSDTLWDRERDKSGSAAHSKARGRERDHKNEFVIGTDRISGIDRMDRILKGSTEDLTWDSIVVPRLAKYYRTAVK